MRQACGNCRGTAEAADNHRHIAHGNYVVAQLATEVVAPTATCAVIIVVQHRGAGPFEPGYSSATNAIVDAIEDERARAEVKDAIKLRLFDSAVKLVEAPAALQLLS